MTYLFAIVWFAAALFFIWAVYDIHKSHCEYNKPVEKGQKLDEKIKLAALHKEACKEVQAWIDSQRTVPKYKAVITLLNGDKLHTNAFDNTADIYLSGDGNMYYKILRTSHDHAKIFAETTLNCSRFHYVEGNTYYPTREIQSIEVTVYESK